MEKNQTEEEEKATLHTTSHPTPPRTLSEKSIITHLPSVEAFYHILQHNSGLVLIKFTADWCGPCKRIKPAVDAFFAQSPDSVICMSLKIEENMEIYTYLKKKQMVAGIPTILAYKKGNTNFMSDACVIGSDARQLHEFMKTCNRMHATLRP